MLHKVSSILYHVRSVEKGAIMKFTLDVNHKEELERLVEFESTPSGVVRRAKILLLKDTGLSNDAIAKELGMNRHSVDRWVRGYRQIGPEDSVEMALRVADGRGRKPVKGKEKA